MNINESSIQEFGARLAAHGRNYELLEQQNSERVRVRFIGGFGGETVVWDATLMTLRRSLAEARARDGGVADGGRLRPFIHVGPRLGPMRAITIGLALEAIDVPAIRKTIIMVQQYKRLKEGRHEYGEYRRL